MLQRIITGSILCSITKQKARRYNKSQFIRAFKQRKLNKKNIEELKSNIEKDGEIITPITVMRSATEGEFVILDGWNRFHIAKELNMECPADLYENLSQEQAREIFLSHNFCQRQMSREVKEQLANDLYTEVSLNFSQIAKLLGVHSCTVSRYINPQEKNQSKD